MLTTIRAAALGIAALAMAGCPSTPEVKPDDKPTKATGPAKPVKKAPEVSKVAKQAFQQAVKAYYAQKKSGRFDYEDLLSRFKGALEEDPKLAEAHYNLGCIYEAMRDDEKAEQHYKQALEISPDLYLAAANWGALLARHGKLNQALSIYQKALSKDAKNSPVLLNMASIYQQQKKFDLAIQRASEVLVRDPGNIGAYRVMASTYYDTGKYDMARLLCYRGLKVKENDPSLLNTLGLTLLKLNKVTEALAQFRAALAQRPDMVPTRFNIAKVALDYKDFRVARDEFTKILEYEPGNRRAAYGVAIAMRGVGDFDGAKDQFAALAKKYGKDPIPRQWLCRLQLRNFSNPKAARQECGQCLKLLGAKPEDGHPCLAMYKEASQGIEMEKKMKEMEAKAMAEQKKYEALVARLAKLRKDTVDKAWDEAKAKCQVLPPKKLDGAQMEFILDPLAITPDKPTKVRLVGAIFKDEVKRINIGTLKVKWRKIDDYTLEMVVPKGLEEGPWDVLLTLKDKSEMYFGGGLWVGKKPECKKPEKAKEPEKKDENGNPGPGAEPAKKGPKGEEPAGGKDVKTQAAGKGSGAKAKPGDKPQSGKDKKPEAAPAGKAAPAGEPEEPKDPAGS